MTEADQDNTVIVSSEVKAQFSALVEPVFSQHYREPCYLGLVFHQGKRKMLQINVPAKDLPTLLQAKPSTNNNPDSGKNRPEVKGHAEEIKEYILERAKANKPWVLGTITANIDEQQIQIYELGRGICIVVIPDGVKLDITDGQHRKRAIHELILSDQSYLISNNDFPITLILEGEKRQCQTDFRDMAQTRQLDKSLLLSFGEFEGRIGIIKNLIEDVRMFQTKVEQIKKSPATKQKLIYTTNYLARFVSCIFTDSSSNELKGYDVDQLSEALAECLNQFFSNCRDTKAISETNVEILTIEQISTFKENSLLGVSVGLEVLGRLLHSTYDSSSNSFNMQRVSQLTELDWSRKASLWDTNIVRKASNSENPADITYNVSTSPTAVNDAVKIVKARLGWI